MLHVQPWACSITQTSYRRNKNSSAFSADYAWLARVLLGASWTRERPPLTSHALMAAPLLCLGIRMAFYLAKTQNTDTSPTPHPPTHWRSLPHDAPRRLHLLLSHWARHGDTLSMPSPWRTASGLRHPSQCLHSQDWETYMFDMAVPPLPPCADTYLNMTKTLGTVV